MLREMREDRADIDEIRKLQFERDKKYLAVDEWLASPETIPLDSMNATFLSWKPQPLAATFGMDTLVAV